MKKFTLLLILLTGMIGNMSAQTVIGHWSGCNKLIVFPTSLSQPEDIWTPYFRTIICRDKNVTKGFIKKWKYEFYLEKWIVTGPGQAAWVYVNKVKKNFPLQEFDNLLDGVKYRVRIRTTRHFNYPAYDDHCNEIGKIESDAIWSNWVIFEPGSPTASANMTDISGTWYNETYCVEDVDWILLSGENSYAESGYYVGIKKLDGNQAWAGMWFDGQAGVVNLLDDVWVPYGGPNWTFWPGTYEVTFAVKKDNCNGWVVAPTMNFSVVNAGCRIGTFESENDINLYPNPASSILTVENLNTNAEDMKYEIFGNTGRVLNRGMVSNQSSIDIQDLTNGTYMLRVIIDEEVITKKFIVSK